jgi:hypothetical protein
MIKTEYKRRDFANMLIELWVPQKAGYFELAERLLASQEIFPSFKLVSSFLRLKYLHNHKPSISSSLKLLGEEISLYFLVSLFFPSTSISLTLQ